jgi:hypothetical protein
MSDDDPLERGWQPLRESFGLTAEQWKRLTHVVTLHMALDGYLFAILVGDPLKRPKPGEGPRASERLNKYLALGRRSGGGGGRLRTPWRTARQAARSPCGLSSASALHRLRAGGPTTLLMLSVVLSLHLGGHRRRALG